MMRRNLLKRQWRPWHGEPLSFLKERITQFNDEVLSMTQDFPRTFCVDHSSLVPENKWSRDFSHVKLQEDHPITQAYLGDLHLIATKSRGRIGKRSNPGYDQAWACPYSSQQA